MSQGQPLDSVAPQPPKGALAIIFSIVFIDLMGFGIIIPLLPFYVKAPQDKPLQVTLLFSVFSICQFIGAPVLGAISDRIGRKPVLAFSQVGSAIGYVLLGVATQPQFHFSDTMLLTLVYISRVIDGFTGGNISTAQAYISDVTTPKNRAKGMALIGVAFGLGFAFGPFLGGVLGAIHVSIPAYVAAGFSACAAVLTLVRLPESRVNKPVDVEAWLHPRRFAPILNNRVLVELLAISFCLMAAFVMMESTIGLYLNDRFGWGPKQVGWYFAYIGIIIALVQGGLVRRLTTKMSDWPLAIAGPFLVAIGMLGYIRLGYGGGLLVLFVAGAINASGRSLQMPTISSLISKFSDPKQQGVVFGLYSGLSSLARVAGPVVAGLVYPFLHHTGQYLAAAIIALLMGAWLMVLRQPTPGEAVEKPVPATHNPNEVPMAEL
ncbi:MAG TPA: MFS transporter [Tepidisphaeraceae bacterium]|jgi:DHA1 family tetracycline resistance protein-like MFS transporter|nr:MFS transporter [Tepidisphaeraceae bacterium]